MRVRDALDEFLLQNRANGRSRHTIEQYARHIGWLAAWLGAEDRLEWVDRTVVARFLTSDVALMKADRVAKKATSVNALRSSVCVRAGLLERDPSLLVERARAEPPPPRPLSQDDQRRLLFACRGSGQDEALFVLMLGTGLRVSSVIALQVEDVDLARGELWVRSVKENGAGRVFLSREVREALRAHLVCRVSGPLFVRPSGAPMSARYISRRLQRRLARGRVDRRASPHTLRHTFAAELYARTRDLMVVQAALLHRSIVSTAMYARVSEETLRRVLT